MENIIKKIEEAIVEIPSEIYQHGTASGIPAAYSQGILAGRKQALEILTSMI